MADLTYSLILPKNSSNGSQESFYSVSSQPPPSSIPMPSSQAQEPIPPFSSQAQPSAFQAAGLPVYDIDSYLTDPNNAELLKKTPKGSQSQQKTLSGPAACWSLCFWDQRQAIICLPSTHYANSRVSCQYLRSMAISQTQILGSVEDWRDNHSER